MSTRQIATTTDLRPEHREAEWVDANGIIRAFRDGQWGWNSGIAGRWLPIRPSSFPWTEATPEPENLDIIAFAYEDTEGTPVTTPGSTGGTA